MNISDIHLGYGKGGNFPFQKKEIKGMKYAEKVKTNL